MKDAQKTINIITGLNHRILNKALLFGCKYRCDLNSNIVIPQEILLENLKSRSRSALLSFSKTNYEKSLNRFSLNQFDQISFENALKKLLKSKDGEPKSEIFFLKSNFLESNNTEDYQALKDILSTDLKYKIRITIILQDVFDLLRFRYLDPDYQMASRFSFKIINSFFSSFQFEKTLNNTIDSISNLCLIFGSENVAFLNVENSQVDESHNHFISRLLKKHGISINMKKIEQDDLDSPLAIDIQFLNYLKSYASSNSIEDTELEIKNIQNISNKYKLNKRPKETEINNANKKILLSLRQRIIDISKSIPDKKIMTIREDAYGPVNIFHYFEGRKTK